MPVVKLNQEDVAFLSEVLEECYTNLSASPKKAKKMKQLLDRIKRSGNGIKPRSAKNKGASFQKDFAELVSRVTGIPFDNQSDQSEITCRTMGCSGVDVILKKDALERFLRFATECKNQNTIKLPEWIKQAQVNANQDGYGPWLLVIKSPLISEVVVVMSAEAFEQSLPWPHRKK